MAVGAAAYEQGSLGRAAGAEPILAVAPGTFQTHAALVLGAQWQLLGQVASSTGAWSTVNVEPATAILAHLLSEAARRHGGPVARLVLATPAEGPVGDLLLKAASATGVADVELVPDHVAAVLDPANGPDFPDGAFVLACDLGARWSAGLVRVAGDHTAAVERHVCPAEQEDLQGAVRWLVDTCRRLAAATRSELAGIVHSGGWAANRGVMDRLRRALPWPTRATADPELAVLRGVIRWAAAADRRRIPADPPRWRVEPISWRLPDGGGRLLRWLVPPGSPYRAGAVLAQVRSRSDRVLDLTAAEDGVLLSHPVPAGGRTGTALVAPVSPASDATHHPPPHVHRWWTSGGWLLTSEVLVEWDRAGRHLRGRTLADGGVDDVARPDHGSARPERSAVFVDPDGRFCLFTWDRKGEFAIWDIASAARRIRFHGPVRADRIYVDEARWRMAVELPEPVSVGRYRRTAVTVWDLATGRRIEKLVDNDWRRRRPEFSRRSVTDRFTADAVSPDGRLRAVVTDGTVNLRETATGRVVFRAMPEPHRHAHAAFSADGRFLLAEWQADGGSTVDVWAV